MTSTKKLICGNEAIAEAAVQAGCRFYAGYPITPQNELCAYMARRMPEVHGVFIQAESELAAVNMVFGASVAGARAMTSSSSPGISLKQEGISYLAGCELPAVIVNMSRGGPGLGNIAPSQSDYFQATRGGGHGDYHQVVLGPASVAEAMRVTRKAFDLADQYRTPVMVLGDGLLGQMMEPVSEDEWDHEMRSYDINARDWALTGCAGRVPRQIQSLYLGEGVLEDLNHRLQARYKDIMRDEVMYESRDTDDADIVVVSFGSTSRIVDACVKALRKDGKKIGFFRPITLWPFPLEELKALAAKTKAFLVVEMNAGQMCEDVRLAVGHEAPVHFYGRTGGEIPEQEEIVGEINKIMI